MAKTRVYIALTGNVIKAIKMLQKYYNMALNVIDVLKFPVNLQPPNSSITEFKNDFVGFPLFVHD